MTQLQLAHATIDIMAVIAWVQAAVPCLEAQR